MRRMILPEGVSGKNDHMRLIDRHDFNLVLRQGSLKSFKLWKTARSFENSCSLVKLLGFSFLDRASLFEMVVILVSGLSGDVHQGFHHDEGTSTAQVFFVLDGDAGLFHDTANSSFAGSVTFSVPTARPWCAYEGGLHGESVVGGQILRWNSVWP